MHPNSTNTQNHEVRVHWGGSGAFVAKKFDTASWHELLHHFSPFWTEFYKATKRYQMQPNSTKRTKTWVSVPTGTIGCVRCEKLWRDFVPRTFAPVQPVLHRQPNGPKCIQIVQNTPKYEFRVQWGGSGAFLRKIPTRLRGTNFCTSLARFALSFVTHPNYPKCIQIVQTHWIMRLGSNGVDRVRSLRKIPTRLHGMNFCTTLARFEPSFVRQLNGTKCNQIVWNTPKL